MADEKYEAARAVLVRRPEFKLFSAAKVYDVLKKQGAPLPLRRVKELLQEVAPEEEELKESRRVKRPVPRRRRATAASSPYYRITAPPYSFQMDIIFMKGFQRSNSGATGMLLIVDILSRKTWAYPVKGNTMKVILDAFKQFLKDIAPVSPAFVQADDEFSAKAFADFAKEQDIVLRTNIAKDDHRVPGGGDALGLVDRLARSLRQWLMDKMEAEDSTKWTKLLPGVLAGYNDAPHQAHRTAGRLSPNEVWEDFDELLAKRVEDLGHNDNLKEEREASADTLKVGDWVRIVQTKGRFQKGSARLGVKRYKIVGKRGPNRFVLEDADGERLAKSYKDAELTRSTPPTEKSKQDAGPSRVEQELREHGNTRRFKRVSGLDQDPTPKAKLAEPRKTRQAAQAETRKTRLATGAVARRKYTA